MDRFILIIFTIFFGPLANAALVDLDWQTAGDAGITYDSETNLEWLDLSITANISVNQMLVALGPGGQFDGWRYASESDLDTFILAFGDKYSCYLCALTMEAQVFDGTDWGVHTRSDQYIYWATELIPFENGNFWDNVPVEAAYGSSGGLDAQNVNLGHFLIRDSSISVVPVPATAWLFGTGLLGLIGIARGKKSA